MRTANLNVKYVLAPILIVFVRPILAITFQLCTILLFKMNGSSNPLSESTSWWTVYGTLIDIVCLIVLCFLVKKEGIKLFDLIDFQKKKVIQDILLGVGILIIVFPLTMFVGSCVASLVIYGQWQPILPEGALFRFLPIWAVLYSRIIWWVIWSFTEELVYQGYALQRLKKMFNSNVLAILFVGFGWALQHSFLPYINISHSFWLFLTFFPLTIVMQVIYQKFGRLTPLIIAHWGMDLASVLFMVQVR